MPIGIKEVGSTKRTDPQSISGEGYPSASYHVDMRQITLAFGFPVETNLKPHVKRGEALERRLETGSHLFLGESFLTRRFRLLVGRGARGDGQRHPMLRAQAGHTPQGLRGNRVKRPLEPTQEVEAFSYGSPSRIVAFPVRLAWPNPRNPIPADFGRLFFFPRAKVSRENRKNKASLNIPRASPSFSHKPGDSGNLIQTTGNSLH